MAAADKTREEIRKFALKNATDFGKASAAAVLGKILAENPSLRSDIGAARSMAEEIVGEVNGMTHTGIERAFKAYAKEFERKAEETAEKASKHNLAIEGAVEGKVVTRFPPEPGGYIHIGNLKQCMLSEEIARMYKGAIYLYFDDTNPEKCRQEYVDAIKEDLKWMGVNFGREYYASDYIEAVYESGRRLLRQGDAYVCACSGDAVEKNREAKKACKHRKQTPDQNLALFEDMIKGKYEEGQAIVRLAGDMKADNATFRDPTLFRIKKAAHYRQGNKYVMWPTYHINTLVIDNLNGVTDVIRGKEYEIWDEVHRKIISELGLSAPRMHYEARLRIEGESTSKRFLRDQIAKGVLSGWDDPRLVTVAALRRRGVLPAAIRNFALRFGLSKTDGTVKMEMLLAENKKLIDPVAKHLFFVKDPFRIVVKGEKPLGAKLRLHPASDMGFRQYKTWDEFYVPGEDAAAMGVGDKVRLKDLMCIRIISKGAKEIEAEAVKGQEGKVIQWVSGGTTWNALCSCPRRRWMRKANSGTTASRRQKATWRRMRRSSGSTRRCSSRGSATAYSTTRRSRGLY